MGINKLDLWRAAAILEQSLKSQGAAELRLGKDAVEFEVILKNAGKEEVGEHFRRSITILPPNRFLYLAAFDKNGKVIAIVAARYDDIEGWSLQRFVKELWERSYKTKAGEPVTMAPNTPAYAEDITGPVVYLGDGFVSEKWRGNGISAGMIRLLVLLVWDEWKPNIAYGWMRSHHALSGLHMKWGLTEAYEAAFDFVDSPDADYHNDAYFVSCRKAAIHQMVFSLLKADRQAASNNNGET